MKIKKSMIVLGFAMGCFGVFGGMLYRSHSSEAAVAVWDQQNIVEAVKTVLTTTDILTEEQKKIALDLLNMKSLNSDRLAAILGKYTKQKEQIWNESGAYGSILNTTKNPLGVWEQHLGKIDLILNGQFSPQDAAQIAITGIQIMDQTAKDSAMVVKQTQESDKTNKEEMEKLLQDNAKAEGEMQVNQTGNAMIAVLSNNIADNTRVAQANLALQATEIQRRNAIMAKAENDKARTMGSMNSFVNALAP